MGKEKIVKVPIEELNEWKQLFNDTDNWGIKTRFVKGSPHAHETLNRVLYKGQGYPSTIKSIRKFVKKEQKLLINA